MHKFLRVCILSGIVAASARAEHALTVAPSSAHSSASKWCPSLVNRLPKISLQQCVSSGLAASGVTSQKGFPLLLKEVAAGNPNPGNHAPVRILLIGGIHGDETTAAAIVFKWLEKLNQPANLASNEFQWRIAPVVNPDGLLAARKATRVNANGVDLNRNFPTPNWTKEAPVYWRQKTQSDPRRFPGKAPLSEPESRWIYNQMEQFQPDVIISVHAPFGVLDFDGVGTPPSKFGRLMFNRVGVYPGSLGNYGGLHKDIPVVTIELPNSQQMPSDAEVNRIWLDMLHWVQESITPQSKVAAK